MLQLYQAGNHAQALPIAEQALNKAQTEFGSNSAEAALSLNNLAMLYEARGEKDSADEVYARIRSMGHTKTAQQIEDRARSSQ